jgi:ricin-type beta-trefoil lectin protein
MRPKQLLMLLTGLIPRHGVGRLTATLVLTSASLLALSAAPANATPSDGTIRNAAYSQCIDAPGGALNVRLKLVACSSSGTQQWAFMPTGAANTYVIRNQASGFCIEVNNGTSKPGETVDQFTCNGLASEQWVLEGLNLRHAGTNQCLDTVGGPGSQLMQFTCGQAAPAKVQSWITGSGTTPSGRQISVSNQGAGSTTVFTVTGTGFTPSKLVVIKITASNLAQVQFPETAGADGKFVSRHSVSCASGISLTVTAFEDANPQGTFANAVVTTCP